MNQQDEIISQFNANKVLLSILETIGQVRVSTSTFLDAGTSDKGLVVEYDEESSSFIFKLGDQIEQQ